MSKHKSNGAAVAAALSTYEIKGSSRPKPPVRNVRAQIWIEVEYVFEEWSNAGQVWIERHGRGEQEKVKAGDSAEHIKSVMDQLTAEALAPETIAARFPTLEDQS